MWLSRNNFTPSDSLHADDLNNLANDQRHFGGDINGGGYTIYNCLIAGALTDPTNTLGDILVRGPMALQRLGVGADGLALVADHTQPLGMKWGAASGGLVDPTIQKGDLIVRGAAAPPTRLGVGLNGQVLMADAAAALGVRWGTISGVSAAGADKQIQFNQNGAFGANAALNFDYTNARLGVGTATPAYKLDVAGDINITGVFRVNGVPLSAGGVTSVFTRTGAVVAVAGDYTAALVTNAVDQTQTYANPAWITSLAWGKITGAPAIVSSLNGLSGAITLAQGANITITPTGQTLTIAAAGGASGMADPTTTKGDLIARGSAAPATRLGVGADGQALIADSASALGVKWAAVVGGVSTVFGRAGTVVATAGDYTAALITNAVDSSQTYINPAWITGLAWTKISGAPAFLVDPTTTKGDLIVRGAATVAALPVGTNGQVLTADSTQASGIKWGAAGAGSQTPWTQNIIGGGFYLAQAGSIGISAAVATAPAYMLDIRGPNTFNSQLHLSVDGSDAGAYFITTNPTQLQISGGGTYVAASSGWVAKATSSSSIGLNSGSITFNVNSALTVGAAFTPTVAMCISSTGSVGIASSAPTAKLTIGGNPIGGSLPTNTSLFIIGSGVASDTVPANRISMGVDNNHDYGAYIGAMYLSGAQAGAVIGNRQATVDQPALFLRAGCVGIGLFQSTYQLQLTTDSAAKPGTNYWTVPSDIRLKTNVRPFTDGLDVVQKVNPIRYRYNGKAKQPQIDGIGVDAGAHRDILPDCVGTAKMDLEGDGTEVEVFDFNPQALFYVLINAVKELAARLERIETIEKEIQ